jgi:tetratricopeptide (TPR) repeat protein
VLGLHYFPLSRLLLRTDAALGWYEGLSPNYSSGALWFRAGGEAGFRFNPAFTLSAGGGYSMRQNRYGGVLHSGIYIGLALQYSFTTRKAAGGITVQSRQDEAVYPLFLSLYQNYPAAALTITNHEDAEIRNVELSFRAGDYTSSEFVCGALPLIPRGRQETLPLYADFSPKLLDFTENGRIAGELIIRYRFLGAERESVQSAVLRIAHRNSFPAEDTRAFAALVSPTAPELLEFSKYITGLARPKFRTGLNRNMQTGLWLFEGLLGAGLRGEEKALPASGSPGEAPSEVQYPAQTLAYRSGSSADIGLLYAAALAASGVPAAFIPLEDDFIIAFALGITGEEAWGFFGGTTKILVLEGAVWLPLSMAAFNEGFIKSWEAAAERLASEGDAVFISLEDAWAAYPPVPFPPMGVRIPMPEAGALGGATEKALEAYIAAEIQPLIVRANSQIRAGPPAGPELAALYNRLGNLYIRAGNLSGARSAYERAAGMGSPAAMANRGNVALLERDFAGARRWFTQALALEPGNRAARQGLEQAALREGE